MKEVTQIIILIIVGVVLLFRDSNSLNHAGPLIPIQYYNP